MAEQILELDPNQRGLRTAERYAKSRKLMDATIQSLSQCLAAAQKPLPETAIPVVNATRKSLARSSRPSSYGDAVETNLGLAAQLWTERIHSCGKPGPSDRALEILMTRMPEQ